MYHINVYKSDAKGYNSLMWLMTNKNNSILETMCKLLIFKQMRVKATQIECHYDLFGGKFKISYNIK